MKHLAIKTILSIATMLTLSCTKEVIQDNHFKPVQFSTRGEEIYRWQQQLEWAVNAYNIVLPELKLLGWRSIGTLTSKEQIEIFVSEGLGDDKMFGHTVDLEKRIYDIAPRSELTQKYGIWDEKCIEFVKQQFIESTPIGSEVIELQWSYKGNTFTEKIAVIPGKDELGNGIVFNTINQFLLVKDVPFADWQIKEFEEKTRKAMTITDEDKAIIERCIKQKLELEATTRIGIDGEEETPNLEYVATPHATFIPISTGSATPVCEVSLKYVTIFDLNTATFYAWNVIIEKHNAPSGYACHTNAVCTRGVVDQSVSASHKWGWAWGRVTDTSVLPRVVQSNKDLIFTGFCSGTFISQEVEVLCPMY